MRGAVRPPSYGAVLRAMGRHLAKLFPGSLPTALAAAAGTGAAPGSRSEDPFRVLVSTIISTRTKDAVTSAAAERLLSAAPDARRRSGVRIRSG